MKFVLQQSLAQYKGRLLNEDQLVKALADLLDRRSKEILAKIRASMRAGKSGRMYYKPGGGMYQASAPGEPPAVRTGKLLNSLRRRKSNRGLRIKITAEVRHGKWMEEGTGKVAPRPFMKPVMDTMGEFTRADARNAIRRAIRERNK